MPKGFSVCAHLFTRLKMSREELFLCDQTADSFPLISVYFSAESHVSSFYKHASVYLLSDGCGFVCTDGPELLHQVICTCSCESCFFFSVFGSFWVLAVTHSKKEKKREQSLNLTCWMV